MREAGELPPDAPAFGTTIETDLAEYGFTLLGSAMALRAQGGAADLTNKAFRHAARAFESLVRNGDPGATERGFYRTVAAAAYHLAGYSAVAYSLFSQVEGDLNLAPGEEAIRFLILRELDRLRVFVRSWLTDDSHRDDRLYEALGEEIVEIDELLSTVLNTTICRALAFFDFALQTGEEEPIARARQLLGSAVSLADNSGNVPLWWISSLCLHLVDDLWKHSLHKHLPTEPPEGAESKYDYLRRMFISSLYARRASEIELWPSQRDAARRSTDLKDDLVVSLPTSAGKTRIAEIATLMTLSSERRVLIVTPLRALSAQTERSFRRTFAPLGFSVSSLYGALTLSAGDEDVLRSCSIVIATPEKLDFALRTDPSLIDDIGLVVLDEGHMIGPNEREIRYETLVQRLLRRSDASSRRIVCLSAILPDGEELEDLKNWIRSDEPGDPVVSDWRPTRQRFGALTWHGHYGRLQFDLDNNGPFISRFVLEKPALGRERIPYPRDNSHLTLFAAREFASQGKRTLIFCTQANWVESYAKKVVDLHARGYLPSLLDDEAPIARALEIGEEWLGGDHPAVACLRVGVAIHFAGLPRPFLRELETLVSESSLRIVIASPTLSQGLNINAAVLLIPALYRSGRKIEGEEFSNVAGRAGRAFVDVEGLVVHTVYDQHTWRLKEWRELVDTRRARSLRSGLIWVVSEILDRLVSAGVLDRPDAWEYLANAREAWQSPEEEARIADLLSAPVESDGDQSDFDGETAAGESLSQLVERLDATVFGLIEALDAESADLPRLLDEALNGSLWSRQIAREEATDAYRHKKLIEARARLIWASTTAEVRRSHFAMGVGLESGLAIDLMADELSDLIDQADNASVNGDIEDLVEALQELGERLLTVRPFVPNGGKTLPSGWQAILRAWVSGERVTEIGSQNMRFVEDAFSYRLAWALEAVRARRLALGWSPESVAGGAAAVLENGVPQLPMAMLIRAGLPSRRAAVAVVEATGPTLTHFRKCEPGSNPRMLRQTVVPAIGLRLRLPGFGRSSARISKATPLKTGLLAATSVHWRPQTPSRLQVVIASKWTRGTVRLG